MGMPMNSFRQEVVIAGRRIGPGSPPYVIAELSGNHNHDIGRAFAIIEAAARAGADAVKLQTYTADTLTIDCDRPDFVIEGGLWAGRKLYDLYQEAHTPWAWHEALFAKGRELGLAVFSTPFDDTSVDFLEALGAPAYKIASFELVHLPLLRKVAATRKPVILSTGMADLAEMTEAVETLSAAGCRDLILLHCISAYPAPASEANLRTITDLAQRFGLPIGLSDHTLGVGVPIAAVALGALAIEKHVTLARADGGSDSAFSLEPHELATLVEGCRVAWEAIGTANYDRTPSEAGNSMFRRSIYAVMDIAAGEQLSAHSIRVIRPGNGLAPRYFEGLIGKRARVAIARGTAMRWDLIE
jgi:pseudaminic acid synthase